MADELNQIGRLMRALRCESIAELARELDVGVSTAYAWSARGKVPNEYVLAVALRTGYSTEWLEAGVGKAAAAPATGDAPTARERALLTDFRGLDEFNKRVMERVAFALHALPAQVTADAPLQAEAEPAKKAAKPRAAKRIGDR
ncbi:helix-turn-helix domain-containing protein [Arenimonas sp.]|uniref:helix-turn-helix domain-containing protein n=1 Tax=Arenimonas sp. TaxID=1872635 RepID=UPI0025BD25BB|nr:helix-turn-helix domain-containing protein [Arenimonas sp.]